jgi:hypothetical protein
MALIFADRLRTVLLGNVAAELDLAHPLGGLVAVAQIHFPDIDPAWRQAVAL